MLFEVTVDDSPPEHLGSEEIVLVRESVDQYYPQTGYRTEEGRFSGLQTMGRPRRNPDSAIGLARSRVDDEIDGMAPAEFERELHTGRFAREGRDPDRFAEGRRKPIHSFGRRDAGGQFANWPADRRDTWDPTAAAAEAREFAHARWEMPPDIAEPTGQEIAAYGVPAGPDELFGPPEEPDHRSPIMGDVPAASTLPASQRERLLTDEEARGAFQYAEETRWEDAPWEGTPDDLFEIDQQRATGLF